jgi:cell division protein FtsZ
MEDFGNMIIPEGWSVSQAIIKVIGVGGGGCNAVNEMYREGIRDVDFLICNTDVQSLRISDVPDKIRLGNNVTQGLGAGFTPEKGEHAANESIDEIRKALSGNTKMVFITAGMGGGTGTGATPVIARLAKEMKLLTVGVVTLPFRDEGREFLRRALKGIKELQKYVDSLLIVDNQKIYQLYSGLNVEEAFHKVDFVLSTAIRSITEFINIPGLMNVDFADVRKIMENGGMAMMGIGTAEGPDRATKAVEQAFLSPLLNDCDLRTAKGVVVNITSGKEDGGLTVTELQQIMDYVNNYTGEPDKFKRGLVVNEKMGKKISVTIIATGFDTNALPEIEDDDSFNNEIKVVEPGRSELEEIPELAPSYIKPLGKPVMIEGNIAELEREPAYIRRSKELAKQRQKSEQQQPISQFKIDDTEGKTTLSEENSFIHKTQD